jgi:transcriptional regulator GlxA family with amidase domain
VYNQYYRNARPVSAILRPTGRRPWSGEIVPMSGTEDVTFVLVDEFSHLAFSCAIEPLRIANLLSGRDLYRWTLASENGERAVCSNGAVTLVDGGLAPMSREAWLFVVAGINVERHVTPGLVGHIRRERARGVRIAGCCSGAYILAHAGLLDGLRAAIHWDYHDAFAEEFPQVELCRNVFVADEPFVTASGGTATADLMLYLIEQRHGLDLSIAVADQMVHTAVRHATAEQRVSVQSRHGVRNPKLIRAIQLMTETADGPVSPAAIAEQLNISKRQLERLFQRYLNCSPYKYGVAIRLHKARNLLLQTENSVTDIAVACGFESASHFSRVYRAHFGVAPTRQRARLN